MYEATLAKISHKSKGRCQVLEHVDVDVDVDVDVCLQNVFRIHFVSIMTWNN